MMIHYLVEGSLLTSWEILENKEIIKGQEAKVWWSII
jgi:hypothetical protein